MQGQLCIWTRSRQHETLPYSCCLNSASLIQTYVTRVRVQIRVLSMVNRSKTYLPTVHLAPAVTNFMQNPAFEFELNLNECLELPFKIYGLGDAAYVLQKNLDKHLEEYLNLTLKNLYLSLHFLFTEVSKRKLTSQDSAYLIGTILYSLQIKRSTSSNEKSLIQ